MIVLDTNILISALVKNSLTRKIILESGLSFSYPKISLEELMKYKKHIIKKGNYNDKTFYKIVNKLLEYINLVPLEIIKPNLNKSKKIMKNIDLNDSVFLATAISLNAKIWSNDKHFEKQNIVGIIKTKELIKLFEL